MVCLLKIQDTGMEVIKDTSNLEEPLPPVLEKIQVKPKHEITRKQTILGNELRKNSIIH